MKLSITMLIHNKDDIQFVAEFPWFLGTPCIYLCTVWVCPMGRFTNTNRMQEHYYTLPFRFTGFLSKRSTELSKFFMTINNFLYSDQGSTVILGYCLLTEMIRKFFMSVTIFSHKQNVPEYCSGKFWFIEQSFQNFLGKGSGKTSKSSKLM